MKTNTSALEKFCLYGSIIFAITPAIALIIIIAAVML